MQTSIDNLALSMFDAIRLIPKDRGDGWNAEVQKLSGAVVQEHRQLATMIETLPGANRTEADQMMVSFQFLNCVAENE
ncbi:unnamed protein product, partial [Phaeothamnion confervicola]